ncbi:hypothetical protein [Blastopirellula marina]|uniref:Uncharacterized protein n=1 Tax=Blastopirellula marina DSM 3645 TaxID=314230 RepID=A3ZUZ2_9BACT|nr:hypothetical protein [Blastopirellula marina]EAQ79728.1 hypothetical protein DSM3645_24505 [Blastopirellula marina DSM 3645]
MRFIRLLGKTCAAAEMGQAATLLVTNVVTTEDAAGYRRPVTFFNEQLMQILGLGRWETLDKARKAAIDAGWLRYEAPPRGIKTAGHYWVVIPAHAEGLDDGPMDEGVREPSLKISDHPSDDDGDDPPQIDNETGGSYLKISDDPSDHPSEPPSLTLTQEKKECLFDKSEEVGQGKTPKAKSTSKAKRKQASDHSESFGRWYSAYPRKEKPQKALEAFEKAISQITAQQTVVKHPDLTDESSAVEFLIRRAEAYAREMVGNERKYIAHPTTWLNGGEYDSEYASDAPPPRTKATAEDCAAAGYTMLEDNGDDN